MMWESNVVAAQVEPFVTDYGIDVVSDDIPPFLHRVSAFITERTQTDVSTNWQLALVCFVDLNVR